MLARRAQVQRVTAVDAEGDWTLAGDAVASCLEMAQALDVEA
jgi:hypothetical protein